MRNVHICIPYAQDKNLGKAYNETMARIPDGDSACFIDYDVMLLTADAGKIIHDYANMRPNSLLTCYTNRIHHTSPQLVQELQQEKDITIHILYAEKMKRDLYGVSQIFSNLSGFLMVIPKELWQRHPFDESGKCLGVDTNYWRRLNEHGETMFRMEGLYVFHQYRMIAGIKNKEHLL